MGRDPDRPVKTRRQPHGLERAARMKSTSHGPRLGHLMGSGPARSIQLSKLTARPSPARQIFDTIDPARPRPSHVQFCGPGLVRPTSSFLNARPSPAPPNTCSIFRPGSVRPTSSFSNFRPGPAHHMFIFFGPVRPIALSKLSTRPGPAHYNFQNGPARPGPHLRPMASPGKRQLLMILQCTGCL